MAKNPQSFEILYASQSNSDEKRALWLAEKAEAAKTKKYSSSDWSDASTVSDVAENPLEAEHIEDQFSEDEKNDNHNDYMMMFQMDEELPIKPPEKSPVSVAEGLESPVSPRMILQNPLAKKTAPLRDGFFKPSFAIHTNTSGLILTTPPEFSYTLKPDYIIKNKKAFVSEEASFLCRVAQMHLNNIKSDSDNEEQIFNDVEVGQYHDTEVGQSLDDPNQPFFKMSV